MDARISVRCHGSYAPDRKRPTADRLLDEAEKLAVIGFPRAAAVSARTALEMALNAECRARGCFPVDARGRYKKNLTTQAYLVALGIDGQLDPDLMRALAKACTLGNSAAHGKRCAMSDAFFVIECVHNFRALLAETPPGVPVGQPPEKPPT
jgi:hypothetical protein